MSIKTELAATVRQNTRLLNDKTTNDIKQGK